MGERFWAALKDKDISKLHIMATDFSLATFVFVSYYLVKNDISSNLEIVM